LPEEPALGVGSPIIKDIPTIETDIEANATVIAVGSTSDFWIWNEMNIPTSPIAVNMAPAIVWSL
jgi:hypothetical protein